MELRKAVYLVIAAYLVIQVSAVYLGTRDLVYLDLAVFLGILDGLESQVTAVLVYQDIQVQVFLDIAGLVYLGLVAYLATQE